MFKFLSSSHSGTYFRIALKHFTTPDHVYAIAHGAEVRGNDRKIAHDLLRAGVVHRFRNSIKREVNLGF
jgi:hypothetical protein